MQNAERQHAILTFEQAQRLRGQGLSLSDIGTHYGVSRQYVHKLLKKGPRRRKRTASGLGVKSTCPSTCPSSSAVNQLTVRERKFAKGLLEGKTQKTAALEAVPAGAITPGSAEQWASRTVRRPRFRRGMREILEEAGLTEEALANVHAQNLHANKLIGWGKDEAGRLSPIEYPDYRARQRAVDAGWKQLDRAGPLSVGADEPIRMSLPALRLFRAVAPDETIASMLAEERLVVISNEQALAEGRTLGLTEEDKQAFGDRLLDESGEIIDLEDESND